MIIDKKPERCESGWMLDTKYGFGIFVNNSKTRFLDIGFEVEDIEDKETIELAKRIIKRWER